MNKSIFENAERLHFERDSVEPTIVEVRILNTPHGVMTGYFDNPGDMENAVKEYDGKCNIYCTLNSVNPSFLNKSKNKLTKNSGSAVKNADITNIDYIMIDVDPVREPNTSSTAEEKEEAKKVTKKIVEWLREDIGINDFYQCLSGNGYNLLIPVNLENMPENNKLIQEFLQALDFLFSTETAKVDITTHNPARILKVFGTMSCKGENSKERPHRRSGIISVPKDDTITTKPQIELAVSKAVCFQNPNKKTNNSTAKGKFTSKIDVDKLIEEHNLVLDRKKPFGDGTIYILKTCPWDDNHKNSSARIIQFDNGAISAGCFHNGCSSQNWSTLKQKLGIITKSENVEDEEKKTIVEKIIDMFKDNSIYKNQSNNVFMEIEIDGVRCNVLLKSEKSYQYTFVKYAEKYGKITTKEHIKQAFDYLEATAQISFSKTGTYTRAAMIKGSIYYDIGYNTNECLKISKKTVEIVEKPPKKFEFNDQMKTQITPDITAKRKSLIPLLKKHFRFTDEKDYILFAIYLVCCFIPNIKRPLLILHGDMGASKTMTMEKIRGIVDPSISFSSAFPKTVDNLATAVSDSYMCCFDNISYIKDELSDLLCMCVTKGQVVKRKLYTDGEKWE